jgi:hypothetical protein
VTGGWRKLHIEKLHNFYSSPSIIIMIALVGKKRNAYRILVGKPEGKRPLGRPRCRWLDNTKMELREIGLGGFQVLTAVQFSGLYHHIA